MLITYNHEKYIAQALEGILEQETAYSYEVNVVEDCSTDRTRDVILRYKEKYPDKINLHFNPKNVGSAGRFLHTQKVFFEGFKTLKGEYIAILEGDDYWTSPIKLQKQVEFLESNPDFVGCAHNTVKTYEDGSPSHRFLYWPNLRSDYWREDFFEMAAFFHMNTFMFRNVFKGIPPIHFRDRYSCDLFVTMAHAEHGKIRYFDEDMTVYRAHSGGCYSGLSDFKGRVFNIDGLRRYNEWLGYRYVGNFSTSIHCLCRDLLIEEKRNPAIQMTRLQRTKYRCIMYFYGVLCLLLVYPRTFGRRLVQATRRTDLQNKIFQFTFWVRQMKNVFRVLNENIPKLAKLRNYPKLARRVRQMVWLDLIQRRGSKSWN